jgi:hypothetical protein
VRRTGNGEVFIICSVSPWQQPSCDSLIIRSAIRVRTPSVSCHFTEAGLRQAPPAKLLALLNKHSPQGCVIVSRRSRLLSVSSQTGVIDSHSFNMRPTDHHPETALAPSGGIRIKSFARAGCGLCLCNRATVTEHIPCQTASPESLRVTKTLFSNIEGEVITSDRQVRDLSLKHAPKSSSPRC